MSEELTVKPQRRLGTETSETRLALVDATEQLMVEEGYAAVSARKVAAQANLKPQLVHYYFRCMDDLFLAVLKRMTENALAACSAGIASRQPLKALWHMTTDHRATLLRTEFMALSNHRKEIAAEIARSNRQIREVLSQGISALMREKGVDIEKYSPAAITILVSSLASTVVTERNSGLHDGHEQAIELLKGILGEIVDDKD